MNFSEALQALKDGHRVSREGWNGTDGAFVPWLASQTDLLAEDWGVVKD